MTMLGLIPDHPAQPPQRPAAQRLPPAPVGTVAHLRQLAASGSASSWAWLVEQYAPGFTALANSVLADHHVAQDAVSEIFLHIRQVAGKCPARDDEHARAWLRRLACNVCLMLRRRILARPPHQEVREVEAETAPAADDQRLRHLVLHELAELSAAEQHVLILHYFHGRDHRELAADLACSPGAARMRLHRALQALRERLRPSVMASRLADMSALLAMVLVPMPQAGPVAWTAGTARLDSREVLPTAHDPTYRRIGMLGLVLLFSLAVVGLVNQPWAKPSGASLAGQPANEARPVGQGPALAEGGAQHPHAPAAGAVSTTAEQTAKARAPGGLAPRGAADAYSNEFEYQAQPRHVVKGFVVSGAPGEVPSRSQATATGKPVEVALRHYSARASNAMIAISGKAADAESQAAYTENFREFERALARDGVTDLELGWSLLTMNADRVHMFALTKDDLAQFYAQMAPGQHLCFDCSVSQTGPRKQPNGNWALWEGRTSWHSLSYHEIGTLVGPLGTN